MWYDNNAMNYLLMLAMLKNQKFNQAYELQDEYED